MQLVVMAAMLVLAGARRGFFGCRLTNISITLESCGRSECIDTTICAGNCYQEDPVYIGEDEEQQICNGDWSYEVKHIKGCPVGVTYPVARNCNCNVCEKGNTYCGRLLGDMPSCPSY